PPSRPYLLETANSDGALHQTALSLTNPETATIRQMAALQKSGITYLLINDNLNIKLYKKQGSALQTVRIPKDNRNIVMSSIVHAANAEGMMMSVWIDPSKNIHGIMGPVP
ncbi:MAG: hypothetical protein Q7S98_00660, partial [Deltaproteobacteria bacterium]|nr:hypothetical protein [Deltaproteobacteria bacterium]